MKDKLRELKKNGLHRYKYLVLGRDRSYFEKKALILPKSYLKLVSSTCSCFWLTTYLLCLVDVLFNKQSAYPWIQIVLLFSPTCSVICMRQTSSSNKVHVSLTTTISGINDFPYHLIFVFDIWVLTIIVYLLVLIHFVYFCAEVI
jgi:hypothetical protein